MFHMYGNTTIAAESEYTIYIHYHGRKHQYKFYVAFAMVALHYCHVSLSLQ